jgi:hypothetical protein
VTVRRTAQCLCVDEFWCAIIVLVFQGLVVAARIEILTPYQKKHCWKKLGSRLVEGQSEGRATVRSGPITWFESERRLRIVG